MECTGVFSSFYKSTTKLWNITVPGHSHGMYLTSNVHLFIHSFIHSFMKNIHPFEQKTISNQFNRIISFLSVTDLCRDGWNVRNCSASQVQISGGQWNVQNLWWMKWMKSAYFLQSLNMNTGKFALSQM